MTDFAHLSLAEAGRLIRAKEISPVDYAQALLDRIAARDCHYNAFLTLTPEIALREARAAEREIAGGGWRGPLHGVPYALKDIIDYAGVKTTAHSRILADNTATADATVTAQLRAAGAVLVGKAATHEFAIGGPSFDLPWPPARNPWHPGRFTGGSSSGSGAALAAGFVPAALGTDTGGSVRNPASMCGIVGMKPTYGRVSRRGVVPLSFALDHVGPMTRSVADNAILLGAIAGYDPGDPGSADVPVDDYAAGLEAGVKGLRVGYVRHFHSRDLTADPEMAAALDAAVAVLAAEGAEIREVELAPLAAYAACNRVILLSEAFAIHRRWLQERPEDYGALARQRILPGAFIAAADYVDACRARARLSVALDETLREVDVLVAASSMDPAGPIDDAQAMERQYGRQARTPFNLTGHPAIALPAGFSGDRLPLAMQIVGPNFGEALVYRVARAYERATEWSRHRPPEPQGVKETAR